MTNPIGETEDLEADDALTVSLSRLAYSVPKQGKRTSRFWFSMEDEEFEFVKKVMKPKQLEHIDSQIVDRLAIYKKDSPDIYQKHIENIREFFLKEIAPRTLSASGGTTQATEVIRRLLNTDVDDATVSRFQLMINRATTIKMAEFVVSYFGLSEKYLEGVLGVQQSQLSAPPANEAKKLLEAVQDSVNGMQKSVKAISRIERKLDDRQTGR